MKITVLTYVEKDDDDTSYDVVVEQVAAALKEGGHKVSILGGTTTSNAWFRACGGHLRMPLFVKPLRNDASLGIGTNSLVENTRDMLERIVTIQRKFKDAALVEEYIEGREFYVGLLGNLTPQVFPPIEMDFSGLSEGAPHVLDAQAKWSKRGPEYKGTEAIMPELADTLRARLRARDASLCLESSRPRRSRTNPHPGAFVRPSPVGARQSDG